MALMKVFCEICYEHIANVETDELTLPLRGSMFRSPDPEHFVPPPFRDEAEWMHFFCPYGNVHRAMTQPGRFRISDRNAEHFYSVSEKREVSLEQERREAPIDKPEASAAETTPNVPRPEEPRPELAMGHEKPAGLGTTPPQDGGVSPVTGKPGMVERPVDHTLAPAAAEYPCEFEGCTHAPLRSRTAWISHMKTHGAAPKDGAREGQNEPQNGSGPNEG